MDEKLLEFEANFSVLDRYGTDVTKEEYITNPAIGRDKQIKELILILLTPEKSAILIGKPGIGKTAIVEGLAYRIQHDDVPDALKGYSIVNIKTASLLGTMPSGESKVQKMIDELKQKEKMILFIDEVHMLIGATDSSSLDFANIFKEGLGRGSIKVIGATTTEEYERYILRDKAFTRRFQKVEVPEPSHDETVEIMMGTLPKFEKQTGKKMKYTPFIQRRIMNFIVDITSEFKRVYALGSRYPDVSLTLLKQAFSYTVYDDREFMDIFDIRKAIEDSKNIYQDVKKKELPRFDKEFEDIILEEKGEKPVEEWRKEEEQLPEVGEDDNKEVLIESYDNMVQEKKKKQEVIGKTKKKRDRSAFNTKKDSKKLDDLLITSSIGVIENDRSGVNIPIDYKVTSELMPDGVNDLLLNNKIGSILDSGGEEFEVQTYTRDSKVNNSLLSPDSKNIIISDITPRKKKEIDLYSLDDGSKKKKKSVPKKYKIDIEKKPEKIEIDVSKYLNRDDLTSKPKEDKLMKEEPKEDLKEEPKKEEKVEVKKEEVKEEKNVKKGDDDMYGQNYGGNIDFLMGNGGGYPGQPGPGNDPYGQGFGNNMYQQPPQNNFMMPNQSQGMDFGMGQNSFMPQGMGNDTVGGFVPPVDTSSDSSRETLFGVPMYDETKEKEMRGGQANPGMGMPNVQPSVSAPGAFPGLNDPYGTPPPSNDSFFGAPMYNNPGPQDPVRGPGEGDIFGQLLLPENNMKIEGGKIVDDFSGLRVPPSIGNMNNMIIGDVTNTANQQPPQDMFMGGGQNQFGMPGQMPMQNSFGMPPQDPFGMPGQMPQNQFGMPPQSQFGMPPQNQFGMPGQSQFGMPPQSQFGMPGQSQFGMPPQGQFGMPQNQYGGGAYNPYQPQGPVFNELKVENNLLKKTPPTHEEENFVNYSDLNKGKVSQNDMSKYVSQPEEKPVPRVDLNLETGAGDDDLKDFDE